MRRGSSSVQRSIWAGMYEETPFDRLPWFDPDPSPQIVQAVEEKFLPPSSSVLDIGCGAGSNVLYLGRNGFRAYGIDLSPGAIRAAQERARAEGTPATFRVGDALRLDFRAGEFGGVTDNGCFHTLPLARREDYAREVARVVRPGGAYVLSWVAREHTGPRGPPHRPSLAEVARCLESRFLFVRTRFHPPAEDGGPAIYDAWMRRRTSPQPAPR